MNTGGAAQLTPSGADEGSAGAAAGKSGTKVLDEAEPQPAEASATMGGRRKMELVD